MKIKLNALVKFMLLFFLLVPSTVQALSLGTVPKTNHMEVKRGETGVFTVLFWNRQNSSYPVILNVKHAPDGWVVLVVPGEFMLGQSKVAPPYESEAEYLSQGNTAIKTTPVKVYVRVPESAKLGEYTVLVTANAGSRGEGISVIQERTFKFTVNVIEAPPGEGSDILKSVLDKITGMFSALPVNSQTAFLVLLIISVLAIAWVIYKHV